jgi:hypothetical protein
VDRRTLLGGGAATPRASAQADVPGDQPRGPRHDDELPLRRVFPLTRHSTRQLAARPRFSSSSPTSPPVRALARRAFCQDFPRGPTAHSLASGTRRFSVPFWLVILSRAYFCALSVGQAWRAPPSRLTGRGSCCKLGLALHLLKRNTRTLL